MKSLIVLSSPLILVALFAVAVVLSGCGPEVESTPGVCYQLETESDPIIIFRPCEPSIDEACVTKILDDEEIHSRDETTDCRSCLSTRVIEDQGELRLFYSSPASVEEICARYDAE